MNTQSLELISEAYDKLKNYEGQNGYIIKLKNDVYAYKTITLNDFQAEFIIKNYEFQPKFIGKVASIAEWYGNKLKEKYNLSFLPQRIEIGYYMGSTDVFHVLYARLSTGQEKGILLVIRKEAIFTDFLSEDYHNLKVDFDRYDRLAARIDPNRKINELQKEGIKFMLTRKKCILADGMGMGKSLQLSVAAVEGNYDSILIICPASLKTNWKKELMYYVPEKDITIVDSLGNKTKKELENFLGYKEGKSGLSKGELLEEAKENGKWKDNKFVIINFDIIDDFYKMPGKSKDSIAETYANSPVLQYILNKKSLLIVDEAHKLSNGDSIRYKVISDLIKRGKPESVYLATGTPITNNPQNFFYVLKLLDHPLTKRKDDYFLRYCDAKKVCYPKHKAKRDKITQDYLKKQGVNTWGQLSQEQKKELQAKIEKSCWMMTIANGSGHLEELRERASDVYIRRVKEDLGKLPEKHVYEKFYNLNEVQYAEYKRLWDEYEAAKKEENPDKELNKELIEGAIYRKYISDQMVPNTEAIVNRIIAKGEKVVIMCCYDDEIYTLKDYYGDRAVVYNGKLNLKQKDKAIKRFKEDPDVQVFLGNVIAAGVGITLTCSHYLIFNNISYVPGENRQAEDRIYRIGQENDCHIVYQIFRNTQYEKMWNTVLRKELIIKSVIKKEDEK